ncbi:unnamed protein product [Clonostachys rhizophaga]|uniref:BZIP domain-containing protein n=1 Tax=Clonostachys rhizophaga TaxID=160324 RepID=A0A9N9YUP8_9HYPO|nr:unnamed protein product [Clonostachys rhizophaga]
MYHPGQFDEAPVAGQEHPTPSNALSASSDGYDESSPDSYEITSPTGGHLAYQYTRDFQFQPRSSFPGMVGPPELSLALPNMTTPNKKYLSLSKDCDDDQKDQRRAEIPFGEDTRANKALYETDKSNDNGITDAQLKRKIRNRDAQRAHRERKERRLKSLEEALKRLEQSQVHTERENERLKNDLQVKTVENKVLKATTSSSGDVGTEHFVIGSPPRLSSAIFIPSVLGGHGEQIRALQSMPSDGQRRLSPSAAWDYVVQHELYKRGAIDMSSLGTHVRKYARCNGNGPIFYVSDINKAIQESLVERSNSLIEENDS